MFAQQSAKNVVPWRSTTIQNHQKVHDAVPSTTCNWRPKEHRRPKEYSQ